MELYLLLFLFGFAAFTISTVSGGGGAMILVPLVNFFITKSEVAPLVHLGNFIGRPTRVILFWNYIRWDVVKVYMPWAMIGGFLGAWYFSYLDVEWVQIIIAIFLISSVWQFRFGKRTSSFTMKRIWFAPLGFIVCFLSSITGATGAVLNPFYINYKVSKEELIATKAINSFGVAIVQLSTYASFGKLYGELWLYGLCIGAGAAIGNFAGKRLLKGMSDKLFLQLVIVVMVLSGLLILYRQFSTYFE